MKTILGSSKRYYMRSVSIFLIVVALVAAMVSCTPTPTYVLTMAVAPTGSGQATDETGTSPYAEDTVVDIKAVPDPCYRFVNWDAAAGAFGNTTDPETTFTMPARDVTVTANFEPVPPDHFKFYEVDYEKAPEVGMDVQLVDQFGTFNVTVGDAVAFGNPVLKEHAGMPLTPIADENRHYTLYELLYEEGWEPQSWKVMVTNQFQIDVELTVEGPVALAVPTTKEGHEEPVCLNHFLVYWVEEEEFPEVSVNLKDQFIPDGEDVTVWGPMLFANPVQKTIVDTGEVTEIEDPDEHWVLYDIWDEAAPSIDEQIQIDNQFGPETLDLTYRHFLAVPSQKISWEQPLNHFKTYCAYWAEGPDPPGFPVEDVRLEDQFVTINATVFEPVFFANPVEKWHSEFEWTRIWDRKGHLTFYYIEYATDYQVWEVTVSNQFDPDVVQKLWVVGPVMLAVPTQKGPHDWPADLDHFLVYFVDEYTVVPGDLEVYLHDQFTDRFAWVYEPEFFAIPAQKTDASGTTDIKGDEHLVFYWITGGEFWIPELPVDNQFGPQSLYVWESEEDLLGVPSEKIDVAGPWPYEF